MKKLTALLLALIMILFAAAYAEDNALPEGRLYLNGKTESEVKDRAEDELGRAVPEQRYFDSLSSLLLALKSGRVSRIILPEPVTMYIAARNDDLVISPIEQVYISLCMAAKTENAELLEKLSAAITSLKEAGEIDRIYENCIANIDRDPVPAQIPVIDGAETVRVAVTGDLPPFDYISVDGKPAGFNVEILSAIGKLANINFELVLADSGSRAAMVASERADVIFWMQQLSIPTGDGQIPFFSETLEHISLTEPYFRALSAALRRK